MNREIVTHTHTHTQTQKYYLVIKKKEILPLTTWLDLKGVMPNKISQTDKNKYYMVSLIDGS